MNTNIVYVLRIIAFAFFLLNNTAIAQLSKGFQALEIHDIFKARAIFLKGQKKEPVAAHYGMALIFADSKNHFHNLDSAFTRIVRAEYAIKLVPAKKRIALCNVSICDSQFVKLKHNIYESAFKASIAFNNVDSYTHHLKHFEGSSFNRQIEKLLHKRAFEIADSLNFSGEWKRFLDLYPNADESGQAKQRLALAVFNEETSSGSLESYVRFIQINPQSIHVVDAEDAIYQLAVPNESIDELYDFVKKYPNNRNTDQAWELIYSLFTADQRLESFTMFREKFPEYPYQEKLSRDKNLAFSTLIPIIHKEKWGFADTTGKVVIPCQYEDAEPFRENMAAVVKDGKFGFINKSGVRMVKPTFEEAEPFNHGLAVVKTEKAYGLINKSGAWVLQPEYSDIFDFENSFARIVKEDKFGFINQQGTIVIEPIYDDASNFHQGLAAVNLEGKWGFVDSLGLQVIPLEYDEVGFFNQGLALVVKNDLIGMIDQTGKLLLPVKFDYIALPSEGLVKTMLNDKCAYFNLLGKQIIAPASNCAPPVFGVDGFKEGLVRIDKRGKKGFMDKAGKNIIPAIYDDVHYFSNGLAAFRIKSKWGYINKSGKKVIPASFDAVWPFENGIARVKLKGKTGIINTDGKWLIQEELTDLIILQNGLFEGVNGELHGLYDEKFQLLLPVEYDDIRYFPEMNVFRLLKNGLLSWYSPTTKDIIWQELE